MSILCYNNNVMVRVATDEFPPNVIVRVATDGILTNMNTYMFWSGSPPADSCPTSFLTIYIMKTILKSNRNQDLPNKKSNPNIHE